MLVSSMLEARAEEVPVLAPTASVADAAALLACQHVGIVVICDDRRQVVGVVADSDILRNLAACGARYRACAGDVAGVMTRQVACCHRQDALAQVLADMKERGLRRMPVVEDDGTLAGVVTMRDALLHLYEEAKLEEEMLKEYFLGLGYR